MESGPMQEVSQAVLEKIAEHRDKPGALLLILHMVQREYRYIPRAVAIEVAKQLGVPIAQVYGVITFSPLFKLKEPGRHHIGICQGTACYLSNSDDIIAALEELLGIGVNGVTDDGEFSIEVIACLGCCSLAPALSINGKVYGKVTRTQLTDILATCRGGDE